MRITKPTGITLLLLVAFFVAFSAVAQTPAAAPAAAAPPAAKAAAPAAAPAAPPAPAAAPPAAKTAAPTAPAAELPAKVYDKGQTSYALGVQLATMIRPLATEDVDMDNLIKGFSDKLGSKPLTMQDADIQQAMMGLAKNLQARRTDEMKKAGETNKAEETKYLQENGKKEGVTTLPSGLQYKIIKAGTGPKPAAADMVKVEYKGTFVDGTEFDSSAKAGKPAEFPVGQVIPGWTEALQLMPVGSTWQLAVPGTLAYGEKGRGAIPPSKMLLFEVTLLEIMPKQAPATQPGAVTVPNQPGTPPPAAKPADAAKGSS